MPSPQATFWLLTVPGHCFVPYLPPCCSWIKGQREIGEGGFAHWQFVCAFKRSVRRTSVVRTFGPYHCEPTKSSQANEYVWKDATSVEGTRFELGTRPICVNSKPDWELIWSSAVSGLFEEIPASIRIRSYHAIQRIAADFATPEAMERECKVFWGTTGTGKSRTAWEEAGMEAYSKDPRSKFWCGYLNQRNVVMDEFRGGIDVSHLLRWLDRYPVHVEVKGGSKPLKAQRVWITSNLHPRQWYPDLDVETIDALLRRLNITQFH